MRALCAVFCCLCLLASSVLGEDLETAHTHLQRGHYEEALELYKELAQQDETSVDAALGLSRVHQAVGEWDKALAAVKQALESSEENARLRARLAELQYQRGRYEQAEKTARQVIESERDHPPARLVLADVLTETGRLDEAEAAYRWFIRFYNRTQPRDAETLLLVAQGAVRYARWNGVSQIFDFAVNTLCPDALQDDKHRWQAQLVSGSLLLEKFNRGQALPELRRALAINPQAAEVLAALGEAALQKQELQKAENFAERALDVNPRLPSALRLQADVYLDYGRSGEALSVLERALKVNPNDQRTLARKAACFLLQDGLPSDEEWDALLSRFEEADEPPRSAEADSSRFARLLNDLAEQNPRPGYFLAILGERLDARRRFPAAEKLYRAAVAVMPQLPQPKASLGMLAMHTGRLGEAREILDASFEADPYNVRVSNMRKVLDVLEGYTTLSTEHFTIRFDPEKDRLLARYMAEYLEEVYDGLVERYGTAPEGKIPFEIYHDAKGLPAHQWFSARMIGLPWIQTIGASTGSVVALASPTATDEPFNWARVAKHELVHVLTLHETRFNIPHWFTEALAVTAEGYPRPQIWNRLLLERVPQGNLHSLDELNKVFTRPKTSADWQFAYCQSRLYAEYMVAEYGEETLREMLDAYRNNRSTREAIPAVFGVEVAAFERGYREYLDEIVAELRVGVSEPQKSLAELEKAHRADPQDPQAAGAYARALLQRGQTQPARQVALQAHARNPGDPSAAVVLARLAMSDGNLQKARDYLEAIDDKGSPRADVLQLRAQIARHLGEHAKAADLYETGRRRFPYDPAWLRGLAKVCEQTGNTEKLRGALEEWVRHEADAFEPRKKLAGLALAQQDYEAAVEYGRQALHVRVNDAGVHRLLGTAYGAMQKFPQAVRAYEAGLDIEPRHDATVLALAKTLLMAGKTAAARSRLQSLLERRPQHMEAQRILDELRRKESQ